MTGEPACQGPAPILHLHRTQKSSELLALPTLLACQPRTRYCAPRKGSGSSITFHIWKRKSSSLGPHSPQPKVPWSHKRSGANPREPLFLPRQSPSEDSLDTGNCTSHWRWQRAILLANSSGYATTPLNRAFPSQRALPAAITSRAAVKEAYTCTGRGSLVNQDSHPGEGDQHANWYSRTVGGCRFVYRIVASCCTC